MKRIKHDCRQVFVRFITLMTVCSVLLSSLLCLSVSAAPEEDAASDSEPQNAAGITIYKNGMDYHSDTLQITAGTPWQADTVTGSTAPVYQAPTVDEFLSTQPTLPISDNVYSLTVNTGMNAGTDCIKYFCVRYLDANSVAQTKYVFTDRSGSELLEEYLSDCWYIKKVKFKGGKGVSYYVVTISFTYDDGTKKRDDMKVYSWKKAHLQDYVEYLQRTNPDCTVKTGKYTTMYAGNGYYIVPFLFRGLSDWKGNVSDPVNHSFLEKAGYTINETEQSSALLSAWSRDELLFKTETPIKTITGIEAFIEKGKWSLSGMSVSKVTGINGYKEYGYYSGKYYLSLEKQVISRLTNKKKGSVSFSYPSRSKLLNLGSRTSLYFSLTNVTGNEAASSRTNKVDLSSPGELYTFRLDFVDSVGAGLESLLRQSAAASDPADDVIVEDLALEVYYTDTGGFTRNVTMPVLLSAIGQYSDYAGDDKKVRTMGLCQMGDTIAFTARLPEMDALQSVRLHVGDAAANILEKDCGLKMKDSAAAAARTRKRQNDLKNDPVTIAGISVYKGTCCMSNTEDGTDTKTNEKLKSYTVVYSFSEEKPVLYCTSYDAKRFRILPGNSLDFEMAAFTGDVSSDLLAARSKENLLVRLKTDTEPGSEPTGDIRVHLTYQDSHGIQATENYFLPEQTLSYYGNWPSSKSAEDNFGYYCGTNAGSIVEFACSLPDAYFVTEIAMTLGSNSDEWQLAGVSAESITEMGKRMIYAQQNTLSETNERTSDFRIVRQTTSAQILPFPVDVRLLFSPNDRYAVSTGVGTSSKGAKADYFDVQQTMTYAQTKEDYGFATGFTTYDIDVKVADDLDTRDSNGDAGSVNQFYFQLDFSKGMSSGYVLANQQLSSDGFRSGYDEVFSISVNRDYGDITAIKIIPADVTDDSEVFDKLNIEKITVTQRRSASFSLQYVFNNVGWIDIDYHDKSENTAVKVRKGRSWSELAKRCTDPVKQNVTNLLCEVTALPWKDIEYKGFVGSLYGEVEYYDINDQPRTIGFDVVSQMASYMNRAPRISKGDLQNMGSLQNYFATLTDPDWMLRPNHVDRFFLPPIPELKSLKRITFTGMSRGKEPGYWVVGGLSVFTVTDDSGVIELVGNEVFRQLTTSPFCYWVPEDKEELSKSVLFPVGIGEPIVFDLSDNTVEWKAASVETEVTKFPASNNDTLNVYLFPSAKTRNIKGTRVNIELNYYLRQSAKLYHISQKELYVYDSGKETAMFCYTGLKATGMKGLESMKVSCDDLKILFDHAIVQQVRENVVICTYNISFGGASATLGLKKSPDPTTRLYDVKHNTRQTMLLSFGTATANTMLTQKSASNSTGNDIAVSLQYTSALDRNANSIYYTPYVYLTESGITRLYPGMMAELSFDVPYLDRIIGYKIVSTNKITANIEAAQAVNRYYTLDNKENTFDMLCSFNQHFTVQQEPRYCQGVEGQTNKDGVTLVDLHFETAEAVQGSESGTSGAVMAIFAYKGVGSTATKSIADLSQYIQSADKIFQTGESAHVRFFLPYCTDLTSIRLSSSAENWRLKSIKGYYDYADPQPINRIIDQTIGSTLTEVNVSEVRYSTTLSIYSEKERKTKTLGVVKDHLMNITCGSGDKLTASIALTKNCTAFSVKAEQINANGTTTEVPLAKVDAKGFLFIVPDQESTANRNYRITVWPKENAYEKDVINISVAASNTRMKTTVTRVDGATSQEHDLGQIHNGSMDITCLNDDIVKGTVAIDNSTRGFSVKAIRNSEAGSAEVACSVSGSSFSLKIPKNDTKSLTEYTLTIASNEVEGLKDVIHIAVPPESSYLSTKVTRTDASSAQEADLGRVQNGMMNTEGAAGDTIKGNVLVGRADKGFDVRIYRKVDGKIYDETFTADEKGFSYRIPENFSKNNMTVTITVSVKDNAQLQDVINVTVPPVALKTSVTYIAYDKAGNIGDLKELGYVQDGEMETILSRYDDGRTNEYHFDVNYQCTVEAAVLKNGTSSKYTGYSLTDRTIFFRPAANNTNDTVVYTFTLTAKEDPAFKDVITITLPGKAYLSLYAKVTKGATGETEDVIWKSASAAEVTCEGGDRITGSATLYNSENGFDIEVTVSELATKKSYPGKIVRTENSFDYDIPDNITTGIVRHEIKFMPKDDPKNYTLITVRVSPTPPITVKASIIKSGSETAVDLGEVGSDPLTLWSSEGDQIIGKVRTANASRFDIRVEITDQTTQKKTTLPLGDRSLYRTLDSFTYTVPVGTHATIHDMIITSDNSSAEKRIRLYVKGVEPLLTASVERAIQFTGKSTLLGSVTNDSITISADANDAVSGSFSSTITNDNIKLTITSTLPPDKEPKYDYYCNRLAGYFFRIPDVNTKEAVTYTLTLTADSGAQCVVNIVVNPKS